MVKRLLRSSSVIVLVSLLTLLLDHYGWLKSFETAALDRFFILSNRVPAHDVVLVEIDDNDYIQLFHETSPLDPPTLTDLISAVAKNQPKIIAVDIDTSAAVFRSFKIMPEWPPIVWARWAHEEEADGDNLIVEGVLGSPAPRTDSASGIAIMPVDTDSKIRHFQRQYLATSQTASSKSPLRVDSFHWAVVRRYCEVANTDNRCKDLFSSQPEQQSRDDSLILNLAIDPYSFDPPIRSSEVIDQAISGNPGGRSPVFLSLKDKIVLIGGSYSASYDYHFTAGGQRSGAELTAIAVESELSQTGLREVNHYVLFSVEIVAGLVLVALNIFFPIGWKHLVALASIPILALLGSWVVFSSLALWANFVPTLVAVQLHRLYDRLAEAKDLKEEVAKLKASLKAHTGYSGEKNLDDSIPPEVRASTGGNGEKDSSIDAVGE